MKYAAGFNRSVAIDVVPTPMSTARVGVACHVPVLVEMQIGILGGRFLGGGGRSIAEGAVQPVGAAEGDDVMRDVAIASAGLA